MQDTSTAWRPDKGDELVGTITDISERTGEYSRYPILELRTSGGAEVTWHVLHDVAQSELAALAPKLGDELRVRYGGKHPEKGYHLYRVRFADGRGGEIDWNRYSDNGGQSQAQESDDDIGS